jgi:hypothetical protein
MMRQKKTLVNLLKLSGTNSLLMLEVDIDIISIEAGLKINLITLI